MKLEDVRSFEALEQFLNEFHNFNDESGPYDFNGAFHLFLAVLNNLARNHLDADLDGHEEFGPWLTEEQRSFLKKLDRLS